MSEERKVDVSDLKPGMYVSRLDRPWLESPFPFQGFLLEDWEEVAEVQNACSYVYVEAAQTAVAMVAETRGPAWLSESSDNKELKRKTRSTPRRAAREIDASGSSPWEAWLEQQSGWTPGGTLPVTSLEDEVRDARPLIEETRGLVQQQMQDARNGRSLDTPVARECVENLTESVLRNPDALVCLSALKKRDEYTYLHSLSVCVLSISLGRYLGLPREALLELGLGAFLHDIGKMRIPDSVLNKPGPLTDEEMEIMRKHTEYGIEIVDGSERLPASSRSVIYSHHERLDGSGYTEGVAGGRIDPLTHIVSVCDTYDAMISHRPYKKACSPLDATAELYRARGQLFDPGLVHQFIGCIGVYPVGSLAELNTGEVGVVVAAGEDRLRPRLLVVLDEEHQQLKRPYEINLSHALQSSAGQRLDIMRSLETGAYGLQPSELLGYVEHA
ncbi:MAG: HD-GYP domain-containing protein [Gammaproteobacteria bacterium]